MDTCCVVGVLAGGASRRFGRPKAFLELPSGATMLEHVVAVGQAVTSEVVILGSPPSAKEVPDSLATVPVLPDAKTGCGPMGGLAALLDHATPRAGILLSCDLPALRAPILERLLRTAEANPDADVIAFRSLEAPSVHEACCALYHGRLRSAVADALSSGDTSLQSLLRRSRLFELIPTACEARALLDIDTPGDLELLGEETC
ncbi:MAG: molybdenum cofactor guanylyltransferase [bacterium]|nr:molybdenum cofactor guanylyltransferase [bacterium]